MSRASDKSSNLFSMNKNQDKNFKWFFSEPIKVYGSPIDCSFCTLEKIVFHSLQVLYFEFPCNVECILMIESYIHICVIMCMHIVIHRMNNQLHMYTNFGKVPPKRLVDLFLRTLRLA